MTAADSVLAYHERTKHHFHRYARSLGHLDWANQPHPFRSYEGAPRFALELDRNPDSLPYERLYVPGAVPARPIGPESLADFLRYSLALSAWKQASANRWALRVNPSSGNLHPTEAYLLLKSFADAKGSGLYHYTSEDHALELRASFPDHLWPDLMGSLPDDSFLIGLSSILWREAWKYGERAFRYCQHDIGHALAALRLSAAMCGWSFRLLPNWSTEDVARLLGLDRHDEFVPEEHEEPELLALVAPLSTEFCPAPSDSVVDAIRSANWYGRANRLSAEYVVWPVIDGVADATRAQAIHPAELPELNSFERPPLWNVPDEVEAHQIVLQRRSALALDGRSTIPREVFLRMLARTLPTPHAPWDALWWPATIHLALFVHRVEGLAPGIYLLVRRGDRQKRLRAALSDRFIWERPLGLPEDLPLYLMQEADCKEAARMLSCHQDIAGDGFFSLGMIAEFTESLEHYGPWFYRNLFWESGLIGQVLYLEAEAAGARSTGIGCYFDDPVHDVLGLKDAQFQSLYHFTVGIPVADPRLQTSPAYPATAG